MERPVADDAKWSNRPTEGQADRLTEGEQLLLAGLRMWVSLRLGGAEPQGPVRDMVARRVNDRAGAIFVALMEGLERQTLRPLEVRCPGCAAYGLDEQRLVVACGVARVDMSLARALLRPLVIQPEPVAIFARALNMVLRHEGLDLPTRIGGSVEAGPLTAAGGVAPGVTLH